MSNAFDASHLPKSPTAPVILSIAYPYAPVGPKAVGGAEVILSQIESAAQTHGFRSVVVAHAQSAPTGRLFAAQVPAGEITEALRAEVEKNMQRAIDRALASEPVALVHMHGLDFHRYRIPEEIPVLVTLHLPPSWYPETIWSLPPNFNLLCVSKTQREACPATVRDRIRVIENGVPLPDASTLRPSGSYALLMARICPEKNLHTGLDAASRAGLSAVLAGDVFPYPEHLQYFAEQIQPRLTQTSGDHVPRHGDTCRKVDARFVGPVTEAAKTRLLTRAACLVLPSLAPETSSLVAMEALAAGVPVIAMASGAVPEIVNDGGTGFLIEPGPEAVAQMADAIVRLPEISRARCRHVAESRFGLNRMLQSYLDLYRALVPPMAATPLERPTSALASIAALEPEDVLIDEIETTEALDQLGAEWHILWQRDAQATPFQHPAWLLPWWRQFGPDGRLHALAMRHRRSGELLGLVPLYTLLAGTEPQLLLAGAGTSDYLDGIWSGDGTAALTLADAALHHTVLQADWRSMSLMQLREGSPLLHIAAQPGWNEQLQQQLAEPCSQLDLNSALPSKLATNHRRYRRRAEAHGQLGLAVASSAGEALAWFEELRELHQHRWQQCGEPGVLADARVLAHNREAIPALLAAGLLHLFRLTLNGDTLGVLYALGDTPGHASRRLYLYLIGVDTHRANLSPGTLLLHEVHEYAKAAGFRYLDLLRGGEDYKRLWGAEQRPTYMLQARHAE